MKKQTLWILELLAWGLIIFSVLFVCVYFHNKHIRENNTYYVLFKDVDGLIKGSPVKIQGYQIGYISNITLIEDEAFVTFVVTDKNIEMPDSLSASVAFTGMGGSKSLELFASKETNDNKNYIKTIEPKRINDFYANQNQIAGLLISIMSDVMNIMDEKNTMLLQDFLKKPVLLDNVGDTLEMIDNSEQKYMQKRGKNVYK